ncbi:MAG: MFS transporter [Opitutaceae bacterium]|jgi:GPH family glycoside/pentoside/hexuronide:cation symporter|nr:MFS transporter [Opitutaceae bacterium]
MAPPAPSTATPAPPPACLPVRAKFAWALGSLGDNYSMNTLNTLKDAVYTVALGVSADKLGWALFIPRFIDAFIDPAVGYWSDNFKGKLGRRRPFILLSALPLALLSFLIWVPPSSLGPDGLFWYFLVTAFFFYAAYSFFIVPYRALGLELSKDYNDRTRVQAWGMIVGLLGGLGIPWLYKLTLVFGGASPGDTNVSPDVILEGAKWVGLGTAVIVLVSCIAPAIFCREAAVDEPPQKLSLLGAIRETARNRPFLHMLAMNLCAILATVSVGAVGFIVTINHLFRGDQGAAATLGGWAGMSLMAGAFIGVPINTWISTRIGKRHAAFVCLATAATAFVTMFWTLDPAHPNWLIFSNFILGFGLQGVWLMTATMNADVCDEDEIRTGQRREGLYGAVFALEQKIAFAIAAVIGGYLLTHSGYVAHTTPADEVLERLRLIYIIFPIAGLACAAIAIAGYPLTRQRMAEIRAELDSRKLASTR